MPETSRRAELRLPADDVIFQYPAGVRAQVLRNWIESGRKNDIVLSAINEIMTEIKELRNELSSLKVPEKVVQETNGDNQLLTAQPKNDSIIDSESEDPRKRRAENLRKRIEQL